VRHNIERRRARAANRQAAWRVALVLCAASAPLGCASHAGRATSQPALADATPATASIPASQPGQRLTLEALYGAGRNDFSGTYARGMTWLADGMYLHTRDRELQRIDPRTGAAEPAYDRDALREALRTATQRDDDSFADVRISAADLSPDQRAALVRYENQSYVYPLKSRRVTALSIPPGAREAGFSPKAAYVSFVHENDLFVADAQDGSVRPLTSDGSDTRLNGVLDWVYQEEIYGRGTWKAHWWSADERYLAYLQLDETGVPVHTIVDHGPTPERLETMFYPRAGDPNPAVRLGIVPVQGADTTWVDLARFDGADILIVNVAWAPDHRLTFQVQDREQRWLDLCQTEPDGRTTLLIHESSPAWVNVIGPPHWLADGSFLWRSERDGRQHIYHYERTGELRARLTEGPWDVRDLHGVDESGGWIYFTASRDKVLEDHVYRVPLAGGTPQRLTEPGHTHAASFDPSLTMFFDTFSSLGSPPRVHLRRADGSLLRVISDNDVPAIREYRLGTAELLRVPAWDGHPLNALRVLPPDFDPSRRYPVLCRVYAGPQAPTVRNRWYGRSLMHDHLLAQHGYIVWYCDPRSASDDGAASAWTAYQRLGTSELDDIHAGLDWLVAHGNADPDRIGISGGSYGGYMAAFALTHSERFKAGIAAYPVTDWTSYDSIYTERYMRTPENNPEGYQSSSVLLAAGRLRGRLLLYHGLVDENVHVQNTLRLVERLQAAGKQFELMLYPQDRHGVGRGAGHLREMELRFLLEQL
jgi:dipeptidyl-peptidase-4